MERDWQAFDKDTIRAEFAALPDPDRVNLHNTMNLYKDCGYKAEPPVLVKDYGDDILCLRHQSKVFQGRTLFYISEARKDFQRLTILVVYKKETNKAKHIETAKQRMAKHREGSQ